MLTDPIRLLAPLCWAACCFSFAIRSSRLAVTGGGGRGSAGWIMQEIATATAQRICFVNGLAIVWLQGDYAPPNGHGTAFLCYIIGFVVTLKLVTMYLNSK